ncbi:MAG: hypothetical protein H7Z12_17170 [Rhodospirillaceae bacterium]|nr:hypothetical protein [Rhodospirillales bacterium]
MKRLAIVSVLALSACASEADMPVLTAQPGVAAEAPGGDWIVAQDYAAESVGVVTSPYLGQVVTLDQLRIVDAAGRLCKAPAYRESMAAAATALDNPAQPQAAQGSEPRKVLTVTCDGQPFGTFVALPDGSWLTRINAWVLKLEKDLPKPVEMAKPEPAPVPMGMGAHNMTQPAPPPVAAKPDARTLVYLASYKTEAAAKKGFKTLAKASPILAKQQPVTQNVDLGKKGQWVRLYGLAATEAERGKICGQLGKRVDECGARNRE